RRPGAHAVDGILAALGGAARPRVAFVRLRLARAETVIGDAGATTRAVAIVPAAAWASGRQSFDVFPKSALVPLTSHSLPALAPPSQRPCLRPSLGVLSPMHIGHGRPTS